MDSGQFRVFIFNKVVVLDDIDVNPMLGLDNSTTPINGIQDPMINVCFVNSQTLFVNLYHRRSGNNWHFQYDIPAKKMIGQATCTKLEEAVLNFPVKVTYNSEQD